MGELALHEILRFIERQDENIKRILKLHNEISIELNRLRNKLEKFNAKTSPIPGKMPNCS